MTDFQREYKYFKGGKLPPSILNGRKLLSKHGDLNPVVMVKIPKEVIKETNNDAKITKKIIPEMRKTNHDARFYQKTVLEDMSVIKAPRSVKQKLRSETKNKASESDSDSEYEEEAVKGVESHEDLYSEQEESEEADPEEKYEGEVKEEKVKAKVKVKKEETDGEKAKRKFNSLLSKIENNVKIMKDVSKTPKEKKEADEQLSALGNKINSKYSLPQAGYNRVQEIAEYLNYYQALQ